MTTHFRSKTIPGVTAALFAFAALIAATGIRPALATPDDAEAPASEMATGVKATAAASTLILTTSVNAGVAPAQVTLVATVGGTALKGDIAFRSGATTVGVAAINKNTATVIVRLPAAIHSLTAIYVAAAGDVTSPPVVVVVDNNGLACS